MTKDPRLIRNWWVEPHPDDAFLPPEGIQRIYLCGEVDGRTGAVRTSRMVAAKGRLVSTRSGSVYELGAPRAEYLEWLASRGLAFDEGQPIKIEGHQ